MAEVVWSPRAVDDVRAIAAHIAEDSVAYAKSVAQKVVASTRRLSTFPMSGRVVPEFGDEHIREVFAYSYRIIYRVEGETVTIAAVVHGKRPVELEIQPQVRAFLSAAANNGMHPTADTKALMLRESLGAAGDAWRQLLACMETLKELDCVRVVRLHQPERCYDGTGTVMRPPRVGDVGTIVHLYAAGGVTAAYIVECVDAEGYTIWLADFLPDEIEADA